MSLLKSKGTALAVPSFWLPFPAPTEFRFSRTALDTMRGRYWALPERLIRSPLWSAMWAAHSALTSLVVILALYTYPRGGQEWTTHVVMPARHLASLTGLDRKTVHRALVKGEELGVIRSTFVRHPDHPKLRCGAYSLTAELFGTLDEPYTKVPAPLVYGGMWSLLGSNAGRHLLLTVAALDPVRSVPGYRRRVMEELLDGLEDWVVRDAEAQMAIDVQRAKYPRTLRELGRLSGLRHSTIREVLPPLLVSGAGLLACGPAGAVRWYGHELHRVEEYEPEEMNSATSLQELRAWRFDKSLPHNYERHPREWMECTRSPAT